MTDVKTITSDNPRPLAHYSEATASRMVSSSLNDVHFTT